MLVAMRSSRVRGAAFLLLFFLLGAAGRIDATERPVLSLEEALAMSRVNNPVTAASAAAGSAIRLVKRARVLPGASRVARPMIWTTSVRLAR